PGTWSVIAADDRVGRRGPTPSSGKVFRLPEIIFSHRGRGCIIRRTKSECSMRKPITTSVLLGALLGIGPIQAQTAPAPATPARFRATLTEPPIPGDTSSGRTANVLPAYVSYQGDGDVTAPLVYVNYGMKEDYDALERLGVSVQGKIVIVRYGVGWRGLKPK